MRLVRTNRSPRTGGPHHDREKAQGSPSAVEAVVAQDCDLLKALVE